jgi:hypothetical protein
MRTTVHIEDAPRIRQRIIAALVARIQGSRQFCEEAALFGHIRTYQLPGDLSRTDFDAWWPRLTPAEQRRYLVPVRVPEKRYNRWTRRLELTGQWIESEDAPNVITTNGRTQVLTYLGVASLSAGVVPFAEYFSVGTGAIATISAGDTGMIGELFRAVPSSFTISGNSVNISTFFGATQANGTYTNAGLFGNNASGTFGSGTLVTHAFYSYTKTSGETLTTSYLINLN